MRPEWRPRRAPRPRSLGARADALEKRLRRAGRRAVLRIVLGADGLEGKLGALDCAHEHIELEGV